jgi:RNA polymerase subunit RPABC4/transcription elongation factor Spt4
MPTFKHPCPYCGKFIDRTVAACPFCGVGEPFSPKRCQNCSRIIEDPAWVVCPSCGVSLTAPVAADGSAAAGGTGPSASAGQPAQASAPAAPAPAQASTATPAPPPAPAATAPAGGKCSGCGAPLPAGARFCTVCGTMAG